MKIAQQQLNIVVKNPYTTYDSYYEITGKNKDNILDMYEKIDYLIQTITSSSNLEDFVGSLTDDPTGLLDPQKTLVSNIVDIVKSVQEAGLILKDTTDVLGDYATDDQADELDDQLTVIRNLVLVKENVTAAIQRIANLETQIQAVNSGGVSNYVGTYLGTDDNDISNLPTVGIGKLSRAIVKFLVATDYKYQEYSYDGTNWAKQGSVLDSHIHEAKNQSNGAPVGNVVTITIPAVYGWVKIDQTNEANFKTSDYGMNAKINGTFSGTLSVNANPTLGTGHYVLNIPFYSDQSKAQNALLITGAVWESATDGIANIDPRAMTLYTNTIKGGNTANPLQISWPSNQVPVSTFEIWRLITPAQTVKVVTSP